MSPSKADGSADSVEPDVAPREEEDTFDLPDVGVGVLALLLVELPHKVRGEREEG